MEFSFQQLSFLLQHPTLRFPHSLVAHDIFFMKLLYFTVNCTFYCTTLQSSLFATSSPTLKPHSTIPSFSCKTNTEYWEVNDCPKKFNIGILFRVFWKTIQHAQQISSINIFFFFLKNSELFGVVSYQSSNASTIRW